MTSVLNPLASRNRACRARSFKSSAGAPNLRRQTSRARSNSVMRASRAADAASASEIPLARRSCSMRAAPNLRDITWARASAKRDSERHLRRMRASSSASRSSDDPACGASLRRNSARLCSRRASNPRARSRSERSRFKRHREQSEAISRRPEMASSPGRGWRSTLRFSPGLRFGGGGCRRPGLQLAHPELLADPGFDFGGQFGILLQVFTGVVLALANAVFLV